MKLRSLLAATLVLCLFIGGAVLYTKPAQDRSPKQHVVVPPPNNLSFFDLDKEDRREAQRLTPEEINKIKKKSGQRMVNGMVEIRQDQLPATVVVQQDFFIDKIIFDGDGSCQEINVTTTQGPPGNPPSGWTIDNRDLIGKSVPVTCYTQEEYGPGWEDVGYVHIIGSQLISIPSVATVGVHSFLGGAICIPGGVSCYDTYISIRITGDLTGNVTVAEVNGLQTCVDLKADASTDQKVTSAEINWGDGNATTVSPAPNTQHYFGHECHTYASAGTYTITATYQDDDSHTIHPDTEVTVDCINSASMAIESSGSSNGKNPTKGIYIYCYTATVSHSTAAGESYSYDWTFPDNTTVNSGGGSSDQTASFCIATADINGQSNFGVVSCKITKTTPTPSCDVTVSGQIASPGGPPPPPPPGPPPGDPPGAPGNPPC